MMASACSTYYDASNGTDKKEYYYSYAKKLLDLIGNSVISQKNNLEKIDIMINEFKGFSSSYQAEYNELVKIKGDLDSALTKVQSFLLEVSNFDKKDTYLSQLQTLTKLENLCSEIDIIAIKVANISYSRLQELHSEMKK